MRGGFLSNVRAIRCKTPGDIIVVNAKTLQESLNIAEELSNGVAPTCGHPHMIVIGDVYFSRGKRDEKRGL
jgi:hypothetical protein